MKEDKKIEINYTENIPVEMTDKQKELEELMKVTEEDEALWEEIQREEAKISKNYMYVRKNMTYKGEEIPKDVPFTEYFGYIIRNFRNPKPRKEWTVRDYKVRKPEEEWTYEDYKEYWSIHDRHMMSAVIKGWGKQKEPLTNYQKQFIEMVRNGTDFNSDSWHELLEGLE